MTQHFKIKGNYAAKHRLKLYNVPGKGGNMSPGGDSKTHKWFFI
ncbi:MAG: hypothetical protein E7H06_07875 [Enterobacter asburiae]|nr:hypothetical protein [Enterobacter asburiae]MDU3926964.1 hypothetical protein [Enterobacter asburiae]MEA1018906.1 hypothetical protein [Enterobacter asburiae]